MDKESLFDYSFWSRQKNPPINSRL